MPQYSIRVRTIIGSISAHFTLFTATRHLAQFLCSIRNFPSISVTSSQSPSAIISTPLEITLFDSNWYAVGSDLIHQQFEVGSRF